LYGAVDLSRQQAARAAQPLCEVRNAPVIPRRARAPA
jgi:hypothetical protein